MDSRINRSKQLAESALFALMRAKRYDAISVTEIAETAGISRMSFYRNYRTKDEVLDGFVKRQYEAFIADIETHRLRHIDEFITVYLRYFTEHREVLTAIRNAGIEGSVLRMQTDYFKQFFTDFLSGGDHSAPTVEDIAYYSGAVFSVLLCWSESGYSAPVTRLAGCLAEKIARDPLLDDRDGRPLSQPVEKS